MRSQRVHRGEGKMEVETTIIEEVDEDPSSRVVQQPDPTSIRKGKGLGAITTWSDENPLDPESESSGSIEYLRNLADEDKRLEEILSEGRIDSLDDFEEEEITDNYTDAVSEWLVPKEKRDPDLIFVVVVVSAPFDDRRPEFRTIIPAKASDTVFHLRARAYVEIVMMGDVDGSDKFEALRLGRREVVQHAALPGPLKVFAMDDSQTLGDALAIVPWARKARDGEWWDENGRELVSEDVGRDAFFRADVWKWDGLVDPMPVVELFIARRSVRQDLPVFIKTQNFREATSRRFLVTQLTPFDTVGDAIGVVHSLEPAVDPSRAIAIVDYREPDRKRTGFEAEPSLMLLHTVRIEIIEREPAPEPMDVDVVAHRRKAKREEERELPPLDDDDLLDMSHEKFLDTAKWSPPLGADRSRYSKRLIDAVRVEIDEISAMLDRLKLHQLPIEEFAIKFPTAQLRPIDMPAYLDKQLAIRRKSIGALNSVSIARGDPSSRGYAMKHLNDLLYDRKRFDEFISLFEANDVTAEEKWIDMIPRGKAMTPRNIERAERSLQKRVEITERHLEKYERLDSIIENEAAIIRETDYHDMKDFAKELRLARARAFAKLYNPKDSPWPLDMGQYNANNRRKGLNPITFEQFAKLSEAMIRTNFEDEIGFAESDLQTHFDRWKKQHDKREVAKTY